MPYRIYVKQKSGETVSGIEIHHGPLPKTGDKVDVKLQSGRIIQARGWHTSYAGQQNGRNSGHPGSRGLNLRGMPTMPLRFYRRFRRGPFRIRQRPHRVSGLESRVPAHWCRKIVAA